MFHFRKVKKTVHFLSDQGKHEDSVPASVACLNETNVENVCDMLDSQQFSSVKKRNNQMEFIHNGTNIDV